MARRLGHTWGTVLAVAVLVALAACGDDGGTAGEATTTTSSTTTTTEAPTTTTTEAIDPTTVPDEITEDYVQAVLDELYAVQGEAFRLLVEERQVNEQTVRLLRAIYAGVALTEVLNDVNDAVVHGLDELLDPPGDVGATVLDLVAGQSDCIFVATELDFSQVAHDPLDPLVAYVHLEPASNDQQTAGNPTPWAIRSDFYLQDGSRPEDPCEGS